MKKAQALFSALLLSIIFPTFIFADTTWVEKEIKLSTISGDLYGAVIVPKHVNKMPLVVFVTGSGPVDRNGNMPMMQNDGFKKLAFGLAKEGIASLRYDKRGIAESASAGKDEASLLFEDYINHRKEWINLVKKDNRFSKIIIAGHSEGSLIGMVASGET